MGPQCSGPFRRAAREAAAAEARTASASGNKWTDANAPADHKYHGVSPSGSRFHTQTTINGATRHFGSYETKKEAAYVFDVVARRFPSIGTRPRSLNFSDSMLQQLAVSHPEKEQEIEGMLVEQALLTTTEQQQQMPMQTSSGPC